MKDQSNNQPGAQRHAEGEYGDKARERNLEQLHSGGDHAEEGEPNATGSELGRHKIHEDRQQHDDADLQSEKNRVARDRDRGK